MPAFLSIFTETDFSWLQNRHGKLLGRGSFYGDVSVQDEQGGSAERTFLGPCGLRDDFFRLP